MMKNKYSILRNLISEKREYVIVSGEKISNILAVSIFTRFLNNKKDAIEQEDFERVWEQLTNRGSTRGFYDKNPRRRYYFSSKVSLPIINPQNTVIAKIIDSCLLYANENPDMKILTNKWSVEVDVPAKVNVTVADDLITLDVTLDNMIPFSKKIKVSTEKAVTHGQTIGQKDLKKDFGLSKQNQFFMNLFGLDILSKNIVDNYKNIIDNEAQFDVKGVFEATKYYFGRLSGELNKLVRVDENTITNMVNGIHQLMVKDSSSDYEVLRLGKNLQIYKIDYNKLRDAFKESDIHISIKNTKSPIMAIIDKSRNEELFNIRMRREKYENNVTGNRYKLYFEATNSLLDSILTTL